MKLFLLLVCIYLDQVYGDPMPTACSRTAMQRDYKGTLAINNNGDTCKRWDATHYNSNGNFYSNDVSSEENYCRNPDSTTGGLWCYGPTYWHRCTVPVCDECRPLCMAGQHCYFLLTDVTVNNYADAVAACQTIDAEVIAMETEEEYLQVVRLLTGFKNVLQNSILTSLTRTASTTYTWLTGGEVATYIPWSHSEPDSSSTAEIDSHVGMWRDDLRYDDYQNWNTRAVLPLCQKTTGPFEHNGNATCNLANLVDCNNATCCFLQPSTHSDRVGIDMMYWGELPTQEFRVRVVVDKASSEWVNVARDIHIAVTEVTVAGDQCQGSKRYRLCQNSAAIQDGAFIAFVSTCSCNGTPCRWVYILKNPATISINVCDIEILNDNIL